MNYSCSYNYEMLYIGIIIIILIVIAWALLKLQSGIIAKDDNYNRCYDYDYIDDLTITSKTPHCPDCGNYNLEFRDNLKGVDWLKKTGMDSDFYHCPLCGRSFSDENWKDIRTTNVDLYHNDD